MTEESKLSRRLLKQVKESPELFLALTEIMTRLGWSAIEELHYSELEHLATCTTTYSKCAQRICRKLRNWRFEHAKQIIEQEKYWDRFGLNLPIRNKDSFL